MSESENLPMEPARRMPLWRSHKVVHAAPIVGITKLRQGDAFAVVQLRGVTETITLTQDEHDRVSTAMARNGSTADLGYLVQYEGGDGQYDGEGYISWSPSAAFESGYSRL